MIRTKRAKSAAYLPKSVTIKVASQIEKVPIVQPSLLWNELTYYMEALKVNLATQDTNWYANEASTATMVSELTVPLDEAHNYEYDLQFTEQAT